MSRELLNIPSTSTFARAPRADVSGRGRGRGGRGRGGQGRGRGRDGRASGGALGWEGSGVALGHASGQAAEGSSIRPPRERPQKPRLTHFIAIPLGHNVALRERVSTFTDALLATAPAIPGLDSTIVVPARRLHFTLGVMSLDLDDAPPVEFKQKLPRTLEAATRLLHEVQPKVMEILGTQRLRVPLDSMDIMTPERRDQEKAHVMWVGPADGANAHKLKVVANLVQKTFKQAGLLGDEDRPLKLHCTVLNTTYRKPRTKMRTPFSYPSVLASEALKNVLVRKDVTKAGEIEKVQKGPVRVNFGEWAINEIQICEMGSWGPEGEYVCVARCPLT